MEMEKSRTSQFINKLIYLTNRNYLSWEEVMSYGELEAYVCEIDGMKITVTAKNPSHLWVLVEKGEQSAKQMFPDKDMFLSLRDSIKDFLYIPWEISAWMDEIIEGGMEINEP